MQILPQLVQGEHTQSEKEALLISSRAEVRKQRGFQTLLASPSLAVTPFLGRTQAWRSQLSSMLGPTILLGQQEKQHPHSSERTIQGMHTD
jgi:hypothetical protein